MAFPPQNKLVYTSACTPVIPSWGDTTTTLRWFMGSGPHLLVPFPCLLTAGNGVGFTGILVYFCFQPQSSRSKPSPKKRRKRARLSSRRSKRLGKRRPSSSESSTKEEDDSVDSDLEVDTESSPPPVKLWREKVTAPAAETLQTHQQTASTSLTPELKSDVAVLASSLSSDRPRKRKRIPYTLVEASKGNHCPTSGCDGVGHITGLYAMHFAVSGCPIAHGKTPEECKARREMLNKLRSKTLPPDEGDGGGGGGGGGYGEGSQSSKSIRKTPRNISVTSRSSQTSTRRATAVSSVTIETAVSSVTIKGNISGNCSPVRLHLGHSCYQGVHRIS